MLTRHTQKILIIILLAAALIRGLYLWELQSNPMVNFIAEAPNFDQHNFLNLAQEIRTKGWLGESFAGFSPTYGYFLAAGLTLLNDNISGIFILQMIFGLFTVFLFYKSATILFENKTIGIIAAALAAFYAPAIFYEGTALRASLLYGLNLCSFYLLLIAIKKMSLKYYLFTGFVVGLSVILRPNLLPAFVFILLMFLPAIKFKQRISILILFILGLTLAIAPISLRNKAIGKDVLIAKPGPTIFWLGNTHDTAGIGLTLTETQEELALESGHDPIKTLQILLREIKTYPKKYQALYFRKFTMLFNTYEIPGNISYDMHWQHSTALKLAGVQFGIIAPLALLGFILLLPRWREMAPLYVYFLGLLFFVFLFHIQSRYRMPIVPFFILFAAYALHSIGIFLKENQLKQGLIASLLLIMFVWFTKIDQQIIKTHFAQRINYVVYSNWSFAYAHMFKLKKETGEVDLEIMQKALKMRHISIGLTPDAKTKDTLMIDMCSLYLGLKEYDTALKYYRYLHHKYPESRYIADTTLGLEKFLREVPPELR
ncbi:MAG: 4-amino-4-deoxy-L-arabinose transferase-like glycosyltransferase [Candidatus Omnitrophota bacterium]|jgi:4-amino-4-deoxy-L-arabinose transferase-like glycosyltransferase